MAFIVSILKNTVTARTKPTIATINSINKESIAFLIALLRFNLFFFLERISSRDNCCPLTPVKSVGNFIILDELDSGLDVDSLRIACENINNYVFETYLNLEKIL